MGFYAKLSRQELPFGRDPSPGHKPWGEVVDHATGGLSPGVAMCLGVAAKDVVQLCGRGKAREG